ncbi:MAG TPA: hypothetical protein VIK11_10550 [Tepidiformaceae bacterium]
MAARSGLQRQEESISIPMLGFILFIASEVMFFGGLFAATSLDGRMRPTGRPSIS